ncbi:mutanase [Penicillium canescens]|uniref:mutanase n=1 Tax=Penicillium canescens TaxID=5083 RepID=UPI0026E0C271|nr:mutanase [Penicillium canescens]KAJ6048366.1 mutanase [Penicillium canescens]
MKGLCNFAYSRGYCPASAYKLSSSGGDDDDDSNTVEECVLVLPPYTLPTLLVITFDKGYKTVPNMA